MKQCVAYHFLPIWYSTKNIFVWRLMTVAKFPVPNLSFDVNHEWCLSTFCSTCTGHWTGCRRCKCYGGIERHFVLATVAFTKIISGDMSYPSVILTIFLLLAVVLSIVSSRNCLTSAALLKDDCYLQNFVLKHTVLELLTNLFSKILVLSHLPGHNNITVISNTIHYWC